MNLPTFTGCRKASTLARHALTTAAVLGLLAQSATIAHAASLPIEIYRSLRVTNPGLDNRYLRHQNGVVVTSVLSGSDTWADRIDGTFLVRKGLADPACYSFEANNAPGAFLRHEYSKVILSARAKAPAPALFEKDATWCARDGLAGQGVSLESYNHPGHYLRHREAQVRMDRPEVNAPTFKADATWNVTVALTDQKPDHAEFVYPAPGQMTGPGQLPPKIAKVEHLGPQKANGDIARDLGFSGVSSGRSVWTYGDTLLHTGGGNHTFCSNDAAAIGSKASPNAVTFMNRTSSGCPAQWVPFTPTEEANGGGGRWAEGGTNVIEYAPGKGLVWFLQNDRASGRDSIQGAGVATVAWNDTKGPLATRTMEHLWNKDEPAWGDVGVTYNPLDGKAYVYGHGPSGLGQHVYLARVRGERAIDLAAYEYWDQANQRWGQTRLGSGANGTARVTREQAIFPDQELGQSNAFWSNHHNTWMFVHGANVGYTDVMIKTAPKLEGPWTKSFTIASTCPNNQCSAIRYAITPHPEYDPTGKTLLVTWTDSNVIHAARITFQ